MYFAKKLAAEKKKAIKENKQSVELRAALKAAGLSEAGVLARMNVALIEDLAYEQGVSVEAFKARMNQDLVGDLARERGMSVEKLKAVSGDELDRLPNRISKEVVEKFKALSGAGPDRLPHYIERAELNPLECAAIEKYMTSAGKFLSLREELAAIGLTKDGVVARMNKASVKSVEDFKILSGAGLISLDKFVKQAELEPLEIAALGTYMSKQVQETAADDDLSSIKAKTMYNMVENVHDPTTGTSRKLLFLSPKQAGLVTRDPAAIRKMLDAFLIDKQPPRLVITLLPSLIRSWMRVRPLPGDPDNEREGIAALDRFMAEHIIPLAQKTHAIILCSATQPFCVLSESLSRMVKLVRARWGANLPFTIISCTGHVPLLYKNKSADSTWMALRKLSKVWQERERKGLFERNETQLDPSEKQPHEMDLDPNGTNFIMIDPDISEGKTSYQACNRLVTEIARELTAERPSIAIKTGKSRATRFGTDASDIEVALSNMEVGTPVLLLDLTKRPEMPARPPSLSQNQVTETNLALDLAKGLKRLVRPPDRIQNQAVAATHPVEENAGPAGRRRQIEWYRYQVEKEEAK